MCTKEDVKEIVDTAISEAKQEIEDFVLDMFHKRHEDVSKTVSNQYSEIQNDIKDIKKFVERFDHIEIDDLKEVSKSYSGLMSAKNFIIGSAVFVASIGAIVTGFIALIKSIR